MGLLSPAGTLQLPGMAIDNVLQLDLQLDRALYKWTADGTPAPPEDNDVVWSATQTYLVHECLGTVGLYNAADDSWLVVWYPQ